MLYTTKITYSDDNGAVVKTYDFQSSHKYTGTSVA